MLWTGKQVFDVLIRPTATSKVLVNLEAKSRTFVRGSDHTRPPEFCPADGYLLVVLLIFLGI